MSTVTDEPQTFTSADAPQPETIAVHAETLFDVSGYRVDKGNLKFGGNVPIDLSDERYVDFLRNLKPGKDYTITVEFRVGQYVTKFGEDEGGYIDEVVAGKTVTVHTIHLPDTD